MAAPTTASPATSSGRRSRVDETSAAGCLGEHQVPQATPKCQLSARSTKPASQSICSAAFQYLRRAHQRLMRSTIPSHGRNSMCASKSGCGSRPSFGTTTGAPPSRICGSPSMYSAQENTNALGVSRSSTMRHSPDPRSGQASIDDNAALRAASTSSTTAPSRGRRHLHANQQTLANQTSVQFVSSGSPCMSHQAVHFSQQ